MRSPGSSTVVSLAANSFTPSAVLRTMSNDRSGLPSRHVCGLLIELTTWRLVASVSSSCAISLTVA